MDNIEKMKEDIIKKEYPEYYNKYSKYNKWDLINILVVKDDIIKLHKKVNNTYFNSFSDDTNKENK